ncbi:MAG: RimK family alpha-L-glutamate ligase [Alphaproteobacteria bacterium]|nr:RimK family alpha-L-glutamate ligase [Alphaproteobacteria bacterium]
MKIGILTTGQVDEDKRLVEAATQAGHEITLLKLMKCSMSVCPDEGQIFYDGEEISHSFDIIIPRLNVSYTSYGLAILRQFQALDVYVTDTAYSIELGRDKLRCLQYLMRKEIPFPTTGYADSKDDIENIFKTVGDVPLVIKLIEGTEGTGVFLVDDVKQAENLYATLNQFDAPVIVQKFIAESAGEDLRCFVVGDEIVATMKRESQDGDFRANVSLGGHSSSEELSEQEQKVVLGAAKAIGLNIAGVDLIRSNEGPLIIEINVSPDFCGEQGIEVVTGIDVAAAIIDYAVNGKKLYDQGKGIWLQDDKKAS